MACRLTALLLLVVGLAGCTGGDPETPLLDRAKAALRQGDAKKAGELARQIPADDADWPSAQLMLAEVAASRGDTAEVLKLLQPIPRDGSPESIQAALFRAEMFKLLGRLSSAIHELDYALSKEPDHPAASAAAASLYGMTGQRWKSDALLSELVKQPNFDFRQLVLLTDYERRHPNDIQVMKDCIGKAPDDPAVNLALAIDDLSRTDQAAARVRLEKIIACEPGLATAQALRGELLLDGDEAGLVAWYDSLPLTVRQTPDVLMTCGLWAQRRGDAKAAARCFWEAARQVPASYRAMYQLAQSLAQIDPKTGEEFAQRAKQMYELRQDLSRCLNSGGRDEDATRKVVERLLDLGREWEAWSWVVLAQERFPRASWIGPILERLSKYPHVDAPRVQPAADLLARHDLSTYPKFDDLLTEIRSGLGASLTSHQSTVRFTDQAAERNLKFAYHSGRLAGQTGVRMLESTGGGVSVLDFDLDGLPDLFFPQGENWELGSEKPSPTDEHQDRLFRNQRERFQDVTAAAAVPSEGGYGQGCSAGDFNNDGFVDLYVANLGRNQLLLNQGDGTFRDVTDTAGLTPTSWTTSCLIADMNADGHPDLFDVNYLEGEKLHRIVCDEHNCSPENYTPSLDHVHLSNGDGTFRFVGGGGMEQPGPGLGIVAFRAIDATGGSSDSPREEPRLSLFIANDHAPNFFLRNAPADNPDNLLLTESGFLTGLAVNRDGKATAHMGIACGDVNRDGLLDLFVTNYQDEVKVLFLQSPEGLFADAIAGTGLMAPGLPYVGWGTQFLDADQDGLLDLAVANGHVGDFHKEGVDYAMPTQFFRNLGEGRFEELSPHVAGPFFGEKIFGRGLAILDWNRDGLTDIVVTAIGSNVALLSNETSGPGHWLGVRLHATSTARDALGAVVTVTTDGGSTRIQLTAGDGYETTNERVLRFGLGRDVRVQKVQIEWPGGLVETIENVPVDVVLEVVEGQPQRTIWKGSSAERLP